MNVCQPSSGELELVANCEHSLQRGEIPNLIRDAQFGVWAFPKSVRLWMLLGLAYLTLGDVSRARYVYAEAMQHSPRDLTLLSLYSANCLCAGQVSIALDIIRRSYSQLAPANQRAVVEVVDEVTRLGLVDIEELPDALQVALGCMNCDDPNYCWGWA
jgi:hypothetical protein